MPEVFPPTKFIIMKSDVTRPIMIGSQERVKIQRILVQILSKYNNKKRNYPLASFVAVQKSINFWDLLAPDSLENPFFRKG